MISFSGSLSSYMVFNEALNTSSMWYFLAIKAWWSFWWVTIYCFLSFFLSLFFLKYPFLCCQDCSPVGICLLDCG